MNPKQFLLLGGLILVLVGVLGFVGVLGPALEDSLFGETWYFDNAENWAHLVLGLVALVAYKALGAGAQKGLVILVGLLGLFFAIYNLFSTSFLGANLEKPLDLILHLVVGVWALWASRRGGEMAAMPMQKQPM